MREICTSGSEGGGAVIRSPYPYHRANLDYDTIKSFKDNGLRPFLVGYPAPSESHRGLSRNAKSNSVSAAFAGARS